MTTEGQTVSGPTVYHKAWPSRLERGDNNDDGDDRDDYEDTMRNWQLCAEGLVWRNKSTTFILQRKKVGTGKLGSFTVAQD